MRAALEWIAAQSDLTFAECSVAEEITGRAKMALLQPVDTVKHHFVPHPKWPWFCKNCGYPPQEPLQHIQNAQGMSAGTAKTAKPFEGEARQPGPAKQDAPE
jgi:hypothetical protein